MQLKGGNVVGMIVRDGEGNEIQRVENGDGSPLVFIVEDEQGRTHELYMSVGRMGTFLLLTLPPFKVEDQFQADDNAVPQSAVGANERQGIGEGVPVAQRPRRNNKTRNTSQV